VDEDCLTCYAFIIYNALDKYLNKTQTLHSEPYKQRKHKMAQRHATAFPLPTLAQPFTGD
jgi:hypothetical protein